MSQPPVRSDGHPRSIRLQEALAAVWDAMADDYGLFPELSIDAVLARAGRGELVPASPRLLELLIGHGLPVEVAADVTARLGRHQWSARQRSMVEEVLDAWWQETLMQEPGEHRPPFTPDVVLGILAGYDAPLVRWLEPWLAELDGPGSVHLASVILDGLQGPAWDGKADTAAQIQGWTRTETVINGLTLIGGTHLEDGVLSDVLDRLI